MSSQAYTIAKVKRNWKVDNTLPVGEYAFWHGDPSRLPAPWVHRCYEKHPWSQANREDTCPAANLSKRGHFISLCMIQKLDNLQYLEYHYEKKTRT